MVEVHISLAWVSLADNMDRVKIPRYSHKLMHRKRVTCDLHDSYFCLVKIKHAIPKTAEVHKILSGRELLYNWVHRKFNQLETRCGRESQHLAESWATLENGKETLMAIRIGVNMLQFCLVSNSLSHTTLSIKWEVYFSKRLCRLSLLCRCYDSACICRCICIVGHGYTTIAVTQTKEFPIQFST